MTETRETTISLTVQHRLSAAASRRIDRMRGSRSPVQFVEWLLLEEERRRAASVKPIEDGEVPVEF